MQTVYFKNGGVNISKKIHFTLILALILFLSINVISANEINDNDSINLMDTNEIDLNSNSASISHYLADGQNSDNSENNQLAYASGDSLSDEENPEDTSPDDNPDSPTDGGDGQTPSDGDETDEDDEGPTDTTVTTNITVNKNTIAKNDSLIIYLTDNEGNGLSDKNITIKIGDNTYTKTTDSSGKISLKITLDAKKYSAELSFAGDDDYNATNHLFTLEVTKIKTTLTINSSKLLRGSYLHIFLNDSSGKAISGKNVIVTFGKEKKTLTTNGLGKVYFKINSNPGNYNVKLEFKGDSDYLASSKSFTANVYMIKTSISIKSKYVPRGTSLYIYLKNSTGGALANSTIKIVFAGVNYKKTTDSKGRVFFKIMKPAGKYSTKISYAGSTSHYNSSLSFTTHVYRQNTSLSVANTSVIQGKHLIVILKDQKGNPMVSKKVKIIYDKYKVFYVTTNNYGRGYLKINTKALHSVKLIYEGSGYYKASSKSFTLNCYVEKTKIVVPNASVLRGKWFYAYLKDSHNRAVSGEKVVITFGKASYTKKTDSNGKIALHVCAKANNYSVSLKFSAVTGYYGSSKSLTLKVLPNTTAMIIAKNQTVRGEYSIRLTDMKGNPLFNQTIKVIASTFNHTAGSGKKITQKTIVIDTDNIFNPTKDKKYMNDLAAALRAKGYKVIVSGIGPNTHCNDVKGNYSNACVLCLFGGADSGMFVDMSANWYQSLLKKYNNRVVLGFLDPPNTVNLATCSWLKRAHDDDYSAEGFTGLAYPGTYLNQHGMDYIYGRNATEMANNFVNYAVKGLSIGLKNSLPRVVKTYSLTTNENGYATLSGLESGNYTLEISYSNTTLKYVADTVTAKVEIL